MGSADCCWVWRKYLQVLTCGQSLGGLRTNALAISVRVTYDVLMTATVYMPTAYCRVVADHITCVLC